MSHIIYNFSAGPAAIPQEVLHQAQAELMNYNRSGLSIMEMSHRGPDFTEVLEQAEHLFRELMHIPKHYKVIFVQGGASAQFAQIPMNFATKGHTLYVDTGVWSTKAIAEAQKFSNAKILASSQDHQYNYIPDFTLSDDDKEADYLHITTNNTIYGTCYPKIPTDTSIPLIADMSSDILSKPYRVEDFGMIYAGAQKNIGPSGLAVCIIREDLLERCTEKIPNVFNYKKIAEAGSRYNTPNTFAIYISQLVLQWLKDKGGPETMQIINTQKAQILYDYLDHSQLFKALVQAPYRSIMNIPFTTEIEKIDAQFIQEADYHGLKQLKGHRTIGGMRASIYNAMPLEGVQALVDFMRAFEEQHFKNH